MSRKRRNQKTDQYESKRAIFEIPQFVKIEGLRGKTKFKPSDPISPIFGRKVKDVEVPEVKVVETGDVDTRYDTFRDERSKKMSAEERAKYDEFKATIHTDDSREKFLGTPVYKPTEAEEQRNQPKKPSLIKPIGVGAQETVESNEPSFYYDARKSEEDYQKPTPTNYEEVINRHHEPKAPKIENDDFEIYAKPQLHSVDEIEDTILVRPFEDEVFEETYEPKVEKRTEPKVSKQLKSEVDYKLPNVEMFDKKDLTLDDKPEWLLNQIEMINSTLAQFQVDGRVAGTKKGPTVTRYEISLEPGVNVKRVSHLENNIMMNLAAETIRIEAPIPGKPYVGIEVPNEVPEIVKFGNVVNHEQFTKDLDHPLKVALGVDIDGTNIYTDITKMPHGLIAGATNSGKSVCVNTILVSLLLKNKPDDLKLILIDPKMVELTPYNNLPHLITPVITDAKMAATALKWVVEEMETRYKTFAENRSRDIKSFNENLLTGIAVGEKMPYIVVVIDELADLMAVAANDVEDSIARITSKARAAGIHLLVATQRPSTDVVKGTIKSNIPTRIAFRVASFVDSTTILDGAGAEKLLGKGDMLLKEGDRLIRLQGAWIPDNEIYKVTDFIRKQADPDYLFEHNDLVQKVKILEDTSDELFEPVARYVVEEQKCSINTIQKTFEVGFNRAQTLVQALEKYNIVSEQEGNKAREVLVTMDELEEILGNR